MNCLLIGSEITQA